MTAPLVIERSRGLIRVTGRDPVKMIHGLATADIEAVTPERGAYTTFLTPKGRMVADARVFRLEEGLLLDVATDALPGLMAHIEKFVPPLFARATDQSDEWAVVGAYGPGSDTVAGTALPALGGDALPEDASEEAVARLDHGFAARTLVAGDEGWDLFVTADVRQAAVDALISAGGRPGDPGALEALRVSAGRPRWGQELTEDVIPLEAGLLDRAISQTKGCYTGQEVIIRILHRGHVNRVLRRLEFSGEPPAAGTELFEAGNDKPRGVVTSAVSNEAGALGLGYVRREIEPPAELRLMSPDGDPVEVTALD